MILLLTGAWQQAWEHIPELEAMGHEILFLQQERDPLPCDPECIEGVVCNGLFLFHPIEQFPNLRFIQLTSAGFDRVSVDYVREHEIEIHNAAGVYSIPMAEFALAGILSLYKKMDAFKAQQERHEWTKHRDFRELNGKRVVIIGCGNVGSECAKRFKAFGCEVIGVNRTVKEKEYFDEIQSLSYLDNLLPIADIAVITVALTEETRGLITADHIRSMKPDAILVNISRGAVVPTRALEEAIDRIGGAVLDVFEEEPLPEASPLWDKRNAIITPHNSFVGERNMERLDRVILESIYEIDKEKNRSHKD